MDEQEIEEELICSICMDIFDDPRTFPKCSHTFCAECLKNLKHTIPFVLVCPLCREEYRLGAEGVNGMPRNLFVNNIIEKLRKKGKLPPRNPNKKQASGDSSSIINLDSYPSFANILDKPAWFDTAL